MKQDKFEKVGNKSLILHGEHNNRVYLMKLDKKDSTDVIGEINQIARSNKYTKIICKVPQSKAPHFIANGFLTEAQIPRFYGNEETVFFMAKFLSSDRLLNIETEQLGVLSEMLNKEPELNSPVKAPSKNLRVRIMEEQDAEEMTTIYHEVFKSYPFPVYDPEYIRETMRTNLQYFGVEEDGKLVALASAEMDREGQNAEMTDFATLPSSRGKKLSILLLQKIEQHMQEQNIKTLFTIARLNSVGMNKTFIRMGYIYSGTLIKNTNIAGKIESMNIYYKHV